MARIDKYDPYTGGFRAYLAADWLEADLEKVFPVSLDSAGKIIKGAASAADLVGIIVMTRAIKANEEPIDVMKRGEITEFHSTANPAPAGSKIYAELAGDFEVDIAANVAAGAVLIGHTVESKTNRGARLIVDIHRNLTGGSGA